MAIKPTSVFYRATRGRRSRHWLPVALVLCSWLIGPKARAAEQAFLLPAASITFDSQTGSYGTIYLGHAEGPFTVTPTAGVWYESSQYGNPVPSIYTGPPGIPEHSVLQITAGASTFSFDSLDFSSNNGVSSFSIQGYLGPVLRFNQSGTMQNLVAGFNKLWSSSSTPIDGLIIDVTPGPNATSLNLDNIALTLVPIPEPGLVQLAGLLGGLLLCRFRNRA